MSDTEPRSEGPRRGEVERHVRAAAVMRLRADAASSPGTRARYEDEAWRLLEIAHDLVKADDDAAAFEARVKAGGGVWFPKDGQ